MTDETPKTQTRVHRGRLLTYRDVNLRHTEASPVAGVGGNPNVLMGASAVGGIGEGLPDENEDFSTGVGPPGEEEDDYNAGFPEEGAEYIDVGTGDHYKFEDGEWVLQGPLLPPGSVPPGDGLPPEVPTSFAVTASYFEHEDGTSEPILIATWVDSVSTDVIGYEVQWDGTVLDQEDPPAPIPPDWVTVLSARFGVEVQLGQLTPVIGGNWYGARIRSYDIDGLHSDWVEGVLLQAAPDGSAPDIPDGVSAVGGYAIVGASWDASSARDLSFYEFRFRQTGDPEWAGPFKAKSNRVVIDGLEDEVEYEVGVRAIDRSGNVRVSGDPESDPPDEVIDNYSNKAVGWSESAFASTTLIVPESVAFKELVAEFISTGIISADQIFGGDLLLGSPGREGTIRIYDDQGRATGAWGEFGWIIADPTNPGRAIWAIAGAIYFTSQYDWDGTEDRTTDEDGLVDVTAGIEHGIPTTTWTTAIDWKGINAESITFGSQFGGNNRLLNAGFELRDFDTATLVEKVYSDTTDWGSPVSNINTDVSGSELRMVTH